MSKLSKKNRQVRKQAPTKAVGAIAAVGAKVLPAIAKFAASNPEATKKAGGLIKNMIAKKNNKEEVAQSGSADPKINSSSGSFGAYQPLAAPMSPFAKITNIDAKALNHDVVGSNMKVSGSLSDPTRNVPNTAVGAVTATKQNSAVIDGTTYTTSESTASVNPSTGNMSKPPASNSNKSKPTSDGKSTSNPNNAKNAVESSKSTSDGVNTKFNPNLIGKDTQYGINHKPYWEDVSKDPNKPKWKKRNIIIVRDVEGEIKKGKKISRTNPFGKPEAKPANNPPPKSTNNPAPVKPDLNKKTSNTDPGAQGYLKISNPLFQEGYNNKGKWFPGLNNAVNKRTEMREKGDEVGEAHYQAIIDKLRSATDLNKTQNNSKQKKSEYLGEFDQSGVQVSSRKGDAGNTKSIHKTHSGGNTNIVSSKTSNNTKAVKPSISSNVKGNTSNVKDVNKPEIITNKNGTFRRVKGADNVVTSFEKISSLGGDNVFNIPKKKKADFSNFAGISPFDPNKKLDVQSGLSKNPGTTSTANIASGQEVQLNPAAPKPKTEGNKPKQSPEPTGGKGVKKVKKDLFKERKKTDKKSKTTKTKKSTKNNKNRRSNNGIVKVGKNPLFSSKK